MLDKINEEFKNKAGNEIEYLYSLIIKDIPTVSQWQLEQSITYDEEKNKTVIFSPIKDENGFKTGNQIIIKESNTRKITGKIYKDMFILEEKQINDEEDCIKKSSNLLNTKDGYRKICSFICNDDAITLLVDHKSDSSDLSITSQCINSEKLTDILQEYKEEICSNENIINIPELLEKIYFDNFYTPYEKETINNKVREKGLE